eukprot:GHVP01063527.1.p1 GENE.GHVP01063527.1~~GHVP01063527.1.p1  ORF type:complete len:101 (-),score=22.79 GHVP01063527.1:1027-1329(-)
MKLLEEGILLAFASHKQLDLQIPEIQIPNFSEPTFYRKVSQSNKKSAGQISILDSILLVGIVGVTFSVIRSKKEISECETKSRNTEVEKIPRKKKNKKAQ